MVDLAWEGIEDHKVYRKHIKALMKKLNKPPYTGSPEFNAERVKR